MQELIKELIEKVGLSPEKAEQAVSATVSFVKSKLPEGLSDKVEGLLSGNFDLGGLFGGGDSDSDSDGGSPLDSLKNMFGK